MKALLTWSAMFLAYALGSSVEAQCVLDKLTAHDGVGGERFGQYVDVTDNYAIVGAAFDSDYGYRSGSAYVFERDGSSWVEVAKLLPSDGAPGDWFGNSVAIDGPVAIAGAHYDDDNGNKSGAAYIFRSDGTHWVQEQKLVASDGAAEDEFGFPVAISGDVAVVGSHRNDDDGSLSGSAYVFRFDSNTELWFEEAKLTASDGAANDTFGYWLAIDHDVIAVGSYLDDDRGSDSGSVYMFRYDSGSGMWNEDSKLTASDGAAGDWFGHYLDLSGDQLIVGAYGDDDNGAVSGSAYVLEYDGVTWNEQAKLLADDGAPNDAFGVSVAIDGDTAIVGTYLADVSGTNSGSVYVFASDGNSWVQSATLAPSDGQASDVFGISVAMSGYTAIVGASGNDELGVGAGAAYTFNVDTDLEQSVCIPGSCACGWTYNDEAGNCYRLSPPGTWEEAEAYAVGLGGHLVTIDSAEEDSWLHDTFSPQATDWVGWIGLYQDTSAPAYSEPAGGWTWISGDPVTYTNWYGQEPNNQQGEDFAVLEVAFPPLQWNDIGPNSIGYPSEGIRGIIEVNCGPLDDDDDGIPNPDDNCPQTDNPDQLDNDDDEIGDACDPDDDNDGVFDASDNCPLLANTDQDDNDLDGYGDSCDNDDDNDGVDDSQDNCPVVANSDQLDFDNDGLGNACDLDPDGDGVIVNDNCPFDPNVDQTDTDGDTAGDACDDDDDNDGVGDDQDNCPVAANVDQNDLDEDNIGDACDADIDGDGIDNDTDNCPLVANLGQDDTDEDGDGDACDDDDDDDGVPDDYDNCALIYNPGQADTDGDGAGDVCDGDLDGDGVDNETDNCPTTANGDQNDFDVDGIGDACDGDIDDDGVPTDTDVCEFTPLGEIVDPDTGCSLDQLCPCGGPRGMTVPWKNHGKYVSCVAHSANTFVELGLIGENDKNDLVYQAAQSECGHKD